MEALDQKFGEGAQEEMANVLAESGWHCVVASYWTKEDGGNAHVGEERPEGSSTLTVEMRFYNEHGVNVADCGLQFNDDDPEAVDWGRMFVEPDYRKQNVLGFLWTEWTIRWGLPHGIKTIRMTPVDANMDAAMRNGGMVEDEGRKGPKGHDAAGLVPLKGVYTGNSRMAKYIKWKKGKGEKPEYLGGPPDKPEPPPTPPEPKDPKKPKPSKLDESSA